MRIIERNGYCAFDWNGAEMRSLPELWSRLPELVIGRFLVNTSFDSGHLVLSEKEKTEGWTSVGPFAHSPRITDITQIPNDQFDEWLVFETPVEVMNYESMVSFYGFSPVSFAWDEKLELFWSQVAKTAPLHLFGSNHLTYLVSRDSEVIGKTKAAQPGATDNPGDAQ